MPFRYQRELSPAVKSYLAAFDAWQAAGRELAPPFVKAMKDEALARMLAESPLADQAETIMARVERPRGRPGQPVESLQEIVDARARIARRSAQVRAECQALLVAA